MFLPLTKQKTFLCDFFITLDPVDWFYVKINDERKHPLHGGSEKSGKLEVGGASRDSTGFGALEEGLISS